MDIRVLGLPKTKESQFRNKGINTIEELVRFFPRRYLDFRKVTPIKQLRLLEYQAVQAKVMDIKEYPKFFKLKVMDATGQMEINFFGMKHLLRLLKPEETYFFGGKVELNPFNQAKMMNNPLVSKNPADLLKIYPVYSKIKGMSEEYLLKTIDTALQLTKKEDYLTEDIIRQFNLMPLKDALVAMHKPRSFQELKRAQDRFIFDELFRFSLKLNYQAHGLPVRSPFVMKRLDTIRPFLASLPFSLTDGQRKVLRYLYLKMHKGERVNALIQGDVGCGKTLVAIILMLIACENGYQAALMAPTHVLAKQHFEEICQKTQNMGHIKPIFLSGNMTAKERKEALTKIKTGKANIIVGTHAVISEDVEFCNLALTIVDEEHRFGVAQRNALVEKARQGVHHITMSATPIPRSLALTIYGNGIDICTITTMPQGRKPVKTVLETDELKAYSYMEAEIKAGRQCYVVCPLIEDSDAEALAEVDSVETSYQKLKKHFAPKGIRVSQISGQMKPTEIDAEIERFARGEIDILVSTTIIEVGVNVPNATVMVIKNAERFGLSQLHQLRGRVGRGNHQSLCILVSKDPNNPRLQTMVSTTDGFKIALKDLELRGAGDFIGTRQSGHEKNIMLMLAHPELYKQTNALTKKICQDSKAITRYHFLLEDLPY